MVLNLIWLALVVVAMFIAPRRSSHATIALVCVLALLFPIISASDDFSADRALIESAALAIVSTLLLAFVALVALGRIEREGARVALIHVATPSDPRSPPRA
jgi:amino acid transporter